MERRFSSPVAFYSRVEGQVRFFTGGVQQSYWQGSPAQSVGEFVDVYHK